MNFLRALKEALFRLLLPGGVLLAVGLAYIITYKVSKMSSVGVMPATVLNIAAPVLTLTAFSFLFKRNASDAFFSLPVKRSTLFLSRLCAVAIWMTVLLLPYVIASLTVRANDGHLLLEHVFPEMLASLNNAFYYVSVFLLGAVLTGRRASAVINGLLIAFVPVTAYDIAVSLIYKRLDFLLSGSDMPMLYGYPFYGLYTSIGGRGYFYLILAVVYTVLALILFIKRKSETAQKTAPNRILRIVYGAMIAFSFVLFVMGIKLLIQPEVSFYIIVYGLAVILTLLYSFLSVKRLSGIADGFISIGASVLVYVLMLSFCSLYVNAVRNQKIEVVGYQLVNYYDKDQSRQEVSNTYQWGAEYMGAQRRFGQMQLEDYFITDEENCALVEARYDELREAGDYPRDSRRDANVVLLDKNGKRYYRRAFFTEGEISDLTKNYFLNDPEYLYRLSVLPDPDTVTMVYGGKYINSKADYALFYEEMMALSEKERIACTYDVDTACPIPLKEVTGERICVRGEAEDGTIYEILYGIYPEYHPQTYKMIEEKKDAEVMKEALEYLQIRETDFPQTRVTFTFTPTKEDYPTRSNVVDETASVNLSYPYQINVINKNNPLNFKKSRFPEKIRVLRQTDNSDTVEFNEKVRDIVKNRVVKEETPCTLKIEFMEEHYDTPEDKEIVFYLDLEYSELIELFKMLEEVDF